MSLAGAGYRTEFNTFWYGERMLPLANACINSFIAHGHPCNLFTYAPVDDAPAAAARRDAEPIVSQREVFFAHGGVETFTELFAYNFLYKVGGWVIDNDVCCHSAVVPDVAVAFAEEKAGIINNAVLRFPSAHPAIADLLAYVATIDPATAPWGARGPAALTRIFNQHPEVMNQKLGTAQVYPIHWREAPKLLFPEFTSEVMAKIGDAPFVHLWGSTLRELMDSYLMPPEGSYLHAFYHRYVDPPVLAKMRPPENEREFRTSMQEYIARNWNESLSLV